MADPFPQPALSPGEPPQPRRHTCVSCGGSFTLDRAPSACHGGSSCPFDEPDNWETYEPATLEDWL